MPSSLRLLVLACSLLLALPPGWCCYTFGSVPDTQDGGGACPCCQHPVPAAPDSETPAPPARCPGCPCDERQATSVEAAAYAPDFSLAAVVLPSIAWFVATADGTHRAIADDASPPPAGPHLHLLHCLWLC